VRETSVNLGPRRRHGGAARALRRRGGDWRALRAALEATIYDGASNLGAVRHDGVSAEALWFSDGLATYGAPWRLAFPVPVFAISSAREQRPRRPCRALADASGGASIDSACSTGRARPMRSCAAARGSSTRAPMARRRS
jgi:hypothetical protein